MMIPPKQQLLQKRLIAAALVAVLALGGSEAINRARPLPDYQARFQAASLVASAEKLIKAEKQRRGIKIDLADDPAGLGVIGPKFSPIVTDGSALEVKRTAANPNLAAAVVQMLGRLDVKAGDPVAVLMTGSMPGANLAALAALHAIGAHPTVIASVGPSMWGATDPGFTWMDMATIVEKSNLLPARPLLATPGGAADDARGLDPAARLLMRQSAERNRIPFVVPKNLDEGVALRIKTLAQQQRGLPKVLINVGGGAASYGSAFNSVNAPASLIDPSFAERLQPRGVIYYMLSRGVPVVNLHQITDTARTYGLPTDVTEPVLLGQPQELYFIKTRPRLPLALILAGLIVALTLLLRIGGVLPVEQPRRCERTGPTNGGEPKCS